MTATAIKTRRDSLADVLRRRSATGEAQQIERSAAIQSSLDALTRPTGTVQDVPLDQLHANPFQPRFQFQRQPLEELAQSLADEGQIEPAIARRVVHDGVEQLEIVAGARRLEAARICNATIRPFPTLKVDIRDLSDEEAERISLIENLQRENLTPLEEGYRYWQLQQRDPQRWTVRSIADFVHKKKSSVQNRLGLIKDPIVAEAVLREQLSPTAGFQIMRLPASARATFLANAVDAQLTVEQVRAAVDRQLARHRAPDPVAATSAHRQAVGRSTKSRPAPALAARRRLLQDERTEILARITALEARLAEERAALQAVERELAGL